MKDLKFAVICIICMVNFILFSHHYSVTDIHLILEFYKCNRIKINNFFRFLYDYPRGPIWQKCWRAGLLFNCLWTFVTYLYNSSLQNEFDEISLSIDSTTHVLQRKKCAISTDNCVKQQSITRFSSFYNLSLD